MPAVGTLERELSLLCRLFECGLVLDVGAHEGGFGRRLREDVRFRGDIISFEPSPASFETLKHRSASDDRWTCVNVALGAADGQATLHRVVGDGQFDSLRKLSEHARSYSGSLEVREELPVTVRRLDSVWPELMRDADSVLLKVDTQGFDMDVIEGAGSLLERFPALVLEAAVVPLYEGADVIEDVIAVMRERGYELTGAFPIHRYGGGKRVIEFDCTFVNVRLC